MPIIWFESSSNLTSILSTRLATDCRTINSLLTTYVGLMVQIITTLTSGIIIAFFYEWRTSLVALGLLPFIVISGIIEMSYTQGFSDKTDSAYQYSINLVNEATNNIRTVSSFGSETIIERKYADSLQ